MDKLAGVVPVERQRWVVCRPVLFPSGNRSNTHARIKVVSRSETTGRVLRISHGWRTTFILPAQVTSGRRRLVSTTMVVPTPPQAASKCLLRRLGTDAVWVYPYLLNGLWASGAGGRGRGKQTGTRRCKTSETVRSVPVTAGTRQESCTLHAGRPTVRDSGQKGQRHLSPWPLLSACSAWTSWGRPRRVDEARNGYGTRGVVHRAHMLGRCRGHGSRESKAAAVVVLGGSLRRMDSSQDRNCIVQGQGPGGRRVLSVRPTTHSSRLFSRARRE